MATDGFDLSALDLTLVSDLEGLWDLQAWLGERRDILGLDTETTGLNKGRDRVRTVQFGDLRRGWCVPLDEFRAPVRELLERYDRPTVYHNAIFDLGFLRVEGIVTREQHANCTLLASHVVMPTGTHALKPLATRYVDKRAAAGQHLLKEHCARHGWDWGTVPIDLPSFWMYSALDTSLTAALWPHFEKRLPVGSPDRYAYEIELAAAKVLARAEVAGMAVDAEYLRLASRELERRLEDIHPRLPINANSDRDVIEYFQLRGYRFIKRTEKGAIATDDDVLKHIAATRPELAASADDVRNARRYRRLQSTYIGKMQDLGTPIPEHPGLLSIHCNVRPVAAVTSRMSITEPALQTLPRGRYVRDAFVARPGHKLVIADYAGMEMRVLASAARCTKMIEAFLRGDDMHNYVAGEAFGPGFTKKQRSAAKSAAFAKIYGAGIEQFAVTAGISVEEATDFMGRYDALFPEVQEFMDRVTGTIRERTPKRGKNGYVRLRWGRTIPVEAEKAYKGVNYYIQGSCALIFKAKIIELDAAGLGDYIRLPVHDELIQEVPDDAVDFAVRTTDAVMPDRHSYVVPLEAEAEVFEGWGQKYLSPEYPALVPGLYAWDDQVAAPEFA